MSSTAKHQKKRVCSKCSFSTKKFAFFPLWGPLTASRGPPWTVLEPSEDVFGASSHVLEPLSGPLGAVLENPGTPRACCGSFQNGPGPSPELWAPPRTAGVRPWRPAAPARTPPPAYSDIYIYIYVYIERERDPPPCLWARSGRVLRSSASSPEPQSSVLRILLGDQSPDCQISLGLSP